MSTASAWARLEFVPLRIIRLAGQPADHGRVRWIINDFREGEFRSRAAAVHHVRKHMPIVWEQQGYRVAHLARSLTHIHNSFMVA